MTELTIDRLSATAVVQPEDRDEADVRVRRMLSRIADKRLDETLFNISIPDGDWYIRRLDIPLTLELDRADSAIEIDWAQALLDAIAAAIRTGSSEVACYRRRSDGLRDLIVSAVHQCGDHDWVWREMGLLQTGDPSISTAPLDAVLAAARRLPTGVVAALVACIGDVGVLALHRLLGSRGWAELARLACASLGVPVVDLEVDVPPTVTSGSPAPSRRQPSPEPVATSAVDRSLHFARAEAAVRRSSLAQALRHTPIRLSADEAHCIAILVLAEVDPSCLARSIAAEVVQQVAHLLYPSGPPQLGLAIRHAATEDCVSPPTSRTPPDAPGEDHNDAVEPDAVEVLGLPTLWAGLLFFLHTAAAAGIPDELFEEPSLASRPAWLLITRVVQRILPIADDDPALVVISGRMPDEVLDVGEPFADDEAQRISMYAERWMNVTAARIAAEDEDYVEVCTRIALRRGMIAADRGWVVVTLEIDDVDVDVRRAGLDIDPDWVPWLGAVVRFSYE